MKKIALTGLVLGLTAAAPAAWGQSACPPGSWVCADIRIGTQPMMVQQPVYVQPPPPRVVVVPAPPRVMIAPPPVVYYQPRPMYVQQPVMYQQTVTYQQSWQAQQQPQQNWQNRNLYFGLQGQASASLFGGSGKAMFGGGAAIRLRGRGYFGGEFGVSALAGRDFNGDSRVEVPVTASAMVFFNPQHRFQIYAIAGLGLSFSKVSYNAMNSFARGGLGSASYLHIGAHAGLGFEWQLSQRFSLFMDGRAFIRQRVDENADANPEFSRTTQSGFLQTTNTSAGAVVNGGFVVYF